MDARLFVSTYVVLAPDGTPFKPFAHRPGLAASKALNARIEGAKTSLSRGTRSRVLTDLPRTRQQLQEAWDQSDTSWRRALVAAVVDRVEVGPAVRGRNRFDPDRITVHWRA